MFKNAKWISPIIGNSVVKQFNIDNIENTTLTITGVGLYVVFINDEKIGEQFFAPFFNHYDIRVEVSNYDITKYLKVGINKIQIILGNGWYKGRFGMEHKTNIYGDKLMTIARIYTLDKDILVTNQSFISSESFIGNNGFYDGEQQNYKDVYETGNVFIEKGYNVVQSKTVPVEIQEIIKPLEYTEVEDGVIINFGQNHAGVIRFKMLKEQTSLEIKFAEWFEDGDIYTKNLRSAKGLFTVNKSTGKEIVVNPFFTYYGYQYIKIYNTTIKEVKQMVFESLVLKTKMNRIGYFHTNDLKINRLYENIIWSQKSNSIDIPTDCPQRDERLAWTGDVVAFAHTASLNYDTKEFYKKYLTLLNDESVKYNGVIPNYIPNINKQTTSSSGWGDVATILPFTLYELYKDKSFLEDNYQIMKSWIDYCYENTKDGLYGYGFQLGDWLALDGFNKESYKGGTDDLYISSMFNYHSHKLTLEAAKILNKSKDVIEINKRIEIIKNAILNEFFSKSGRLAIDTQTGYTLSLAFELYVDREKIIIDMLKRLKKDAFILKTGFIGTPLILNVLAQNGLSNIAYILLLDQKNSWLKTVNIGATTIWERWNAVNENGKVNNTEMNSLNHYAYGSVGRFLYEETLGIKIKDYLEVSPKFNYFLDEVSGSLKTPFGKINVSYQLSDKISIEIDSESDFVLIVDTFSQEKINMKKGRHNLSFPLSKEFLYPFKISSLLKELLMHKKTKEIVYYYFKELRNINEELLGRSLIEIINMPKYNYSKEQIYKCDEALQAVNSIVDK